VKSVLLRTGHGGADRKHDVQPDFVFDSLLQAVQFITAAQP